MAKSRKGKKASQNLMIKKLVKTLESKFEECPFNKRVDLFNNLDNWAKSELNEQQCNLFLEALHQVRQVKEIELQIGVKKALARFDNRGTK